MTVAASSHPTPPRAGNHGRKQPRGATGRKSTIRVLALAVLLILPSAITNAQQIKPPKWTAIRVGFDDLYKVGVWTPVELTLRGGSQSLTGRVTLTVPDGDGVPSTVSTPPGKPCMVLPGRESTVRLFVRFGRVDSTATAQFIVDGRVRARREFEARFDTTDTHYLDALPVAQRLYVEVGPRALGLTEMIEQDTGPGDDDVVARVTDVAGLSTQWYGYEGVEAVVLGTSDPTEYRALADGGARLEALDEWVHQGGRLVLCVGRQAPEVLAPGSPLARFAPGALAEMITLRQTGALEEYAGAARPVLRADPKRKELRCPRLEDVQGSVEVREADLPLVVRTPRGFGEVVFLAADLGSPPLSLWEDRPALLQRLLDRKSTVDDEDDALAMMRPGYGGLSGQLRGALDQFEGVRLVPFSLVALLIVVYILLIGPGDFLLVKHVLRRMELTWVTFPLIIVGVSLGAYGLAYWLKGDQLRMNQVDVLDVDAATGRVRGTTWANLFSPRVETFDLSLRPRRPGAPAADGLSADAGLPDARVLFSWQGLPGGALGGMNPRAAGPSPFMRPYQFAPDLSAMLGVPVQVWSSKSFIGRYHGSLDGQPIVEGRLTEVNDAPVGTLVNHLDVPLKDAMLAYGDWVYRLEVLRPAETFTLSDTTPRSDLKTWMTGRKYVQTDDELQQESSPYDTSSTDPKYILRAMSFYELAGGERYAGGLLNVYHSYLDMSGLLQLDRAVLFAWAPADARAADVLRSGQPMNGPDDRATTLCRIVFPVERTTDE